MALHSRGRSSSLPRRIATATRRAFRWRGSTEPPNLAHHGTRHRILASSNLFDTPFYAAQAGIKPTLAGCVTHYLAHGAAAGYSPNRLFNRDAYLALYPDVAAANIDPFLHFVALGLAEGRQNSVPYSCLAQLWAMTPDTLVNRRVSEQALALGWSRHLPSVWINAAVAVYASSLGNFFFRHIADRISEGLRASGVTVYRLDQNSARPSDTVADFFVAPHEFFHLGAGQQWRDFPHAAPSILLNTEQPGTSWYFLAVSYAGTRSTLVDLSPQSAVLFRDLGRSRSGYFPVGFLPASLPVSNEPPPELVPNCGLDALVGVPSDGSRRESRAWRERPIDVLFFGTLTPRRSKLLSRLASTLAQYKCFIHAPTGSGRPLTGGKTAIDVEQSLLLARNAKVMLNIHRDEFSYLEWHRLMMMGIEQGAVVLSEPCFPSPGLEPGRHFLEMNVDQMPETLNRLLCATDGEALARQIDELRVNELRERFDLRAELRALAFLHNTDFGHHA